jgi:hypothetical protein
MLIEKKFHPFVPGVVSICQGIDGARVQEQSHSAGETGAKQFFGPLGNIMAATLPDPGKRERSFSGRRLFSLWLVSGDGELHLAPVGQVERLKGAEDPAFIDGFDDSCHDVPPAMHLSGAVMQGQDARIVETQCIVKELDDGAVV